MNIQEFEKGDLITRVEPALLSAPVGIGFGGTNETYDGVGKSYVFIGIANGIIYCNDTVSDRRTEFLECRFKRGWELYTNPDVLFEEWRAENRVLPRDYMYSDETGAQVKVVGVSGDMCIVESSDKEDRHVISFDFIWSIYEESKTCMEE